MAARKSSQAKATKAAAAKRAREKAVIPDVVTRTQLAEFLGLTPRRITMLTADGVFTPIGRGKLPFAASVAAYVAFKEQSVEAKVKGPTSQDRLRDQRSLELQRKMAREDRRIITLDEAVATIDKIVGFFLTSLSGMPARITRNAAERQRLEKIFDDERQRLANRFAKGRNDLRSGQQDDGPEAEDDAG